MLYIYPLDIIHVLLRETSLTCIYARRSMYAQRFEEEYDDGDGETRANGMGGVDHPSYGGNQPAHCRK